MVKSIGEGIALYTIDSSPVFSFYCCSCSSLSSSLFPVLYNLPRPITITSKYCNNIIYANKTKRPVLHKITLYLDVYLIPIQPIYLFFLSQFPMGYFSNKPTMARPTPSEGASTPGTEGGAATETVRPGTSGTELLLVNDRRRASNRLKEAAKKEREYKTKKRSAAARANYTEAVCEFSLSLSLPPASFCPLSPPPRGKTNTPNLTSYISFKRKTTSAKVSNTTKTPSS